MVHLDYTCTLPTLITNAFIAIIPDIIAKPKTDASWLMYSISTMPLDHSIYAMCVCALCSLTVCERACMFAFVQCAIKLYFNGDGNVDSANVQF